MRGLEDLGSEPPNLLQNGVRCEEYEEDTEANTIQASHKDEAKARIEADAKARAGLPQKLTLFWIHLTGRNVVNITSGTVAPPSVNAENAVYIGEGKLVI